MFPDEQAAIKHFAEILWPNAPVCPFGRLKALVLGMKGKRLTCKMLIFLGGSFFL